MPSEILNPIVTHPFVGADILKFTHSPAFCQLISIPFLETEFPDWKSLYISPFRTTAKPYKIISATIFIDISFNLKQ